MCFICIYNLFKFDMQAHEGVELNVDIIVSWHIKNIKL